MAPRHRLPWSPPVDRDRYLLSCCADRKVLHLACAAWPFTKPLLQSGRLLHSRLQGTCQKLAGIDLSPTGLELMRTHGMADLFQADLLENGQLQQVLRHLAWQPDVMVVGELLEHLDAPVTLLRHCRQCMTESTELIITVPNAFSLKGFLHVLSGREKVANDHVAYYSLMNLRQLLQRAALQIATVRWYRSPVPVRPLERALDVALRPLLFCRPQLADGLIVRCRR